MKRHTLLVPLSQDHHHSLALCVRILRDPAADHRADILAHQADLLAHFAAEEALLAPWWAKLDAAAMQQRFQQDHANLRALLADPAFGNEDWQRRFAETLREHARFEERELFPALERLLPAAE